MLICITMYAGPQRWKTSTQTDLLGDIHCIGYWLCLRPELRQPPCPGYWSSWPAPRSHGTAAHGLAITEVLFNWRISLQNPNRVISASEDLYCEFFLCFGNGANFTPHFGNQKVTPFYLMFRGQCCGAGAA